MLLKFKDFSRTFKDSDDTFQGPMVVYIMAQSVVKVGLRRWRNAKEAPKAPRGVGSAPSPEFFFDLELKMASFGAFWVTF